MSSIVQLYDTRKREYIKGLDKLGERKLLEGNEGKKTKPKKSSTLGYSFYSYKDVIKPMGKPPKRKEKFALSLGETLGTEKEGKKDSAKSAEKYVAIAQGSFPKMVKDNEIIAKLHEKINELSNVVKSIDGIKEGLVKKIKQLSAENEAIESENKKCVTMIAEYKKDPKRFNISNFQKILAKSVVKTEASPKQKAAGKKVTINANSKPA